MEALFIRLCNLSIAAIWPLLAVMFLRLVLSRAPGWSLCLLWAVAALRLVLPFSLKSSLSLVPSVRTIVYEAAEIDSGIAFVDEALSTLLTGESGVLQQVVFYSARVWMIGFALMLIYASSSYILLRLRLQTATLWRDNIRFSENIDAPFVLGVIRPTIYLPYSVKAEDMEYVLAHERAHISRGDTIWKLLGFILLAVYWLNPVLWLAYHLFCRDMERASDEKAIKNKDQNWRRAYSRVLLGFSLRRSGAAVCPLAFGEPGVKRRIRGIMNYKKTGAATVVMIVLLCAAVAVFFLTDPI